MYPPELPPSKGDPPQPSGPERIMFNRFESQLDHSWAAYYSRATLSKHPKHGTKDDETDFILVHPEHGIVCVEVKGRMRCVDGRWERQKDHKWVHAAKDPGKQATTHVHSVLGKVAKKLGCRYSQVRISRLVCFTGMDFNDEDVAMDLPRFVVLGKLQTKESLAVDIETSIAEQRAADDQSEAPGDGGAQQLHDLFAPTIDARPDSRTQRETESKLHAILTGEQKEKAGNIQGSPRAALVGCAGSGKTVILSDMANAAAAQGQRVLFTCYNEALALDLALRLMTKGVKVCHFHALCRELADTAGIVVPSNPPESATQEEKTAFYWEQLPRLLGDVMSRLNEQFDVIVVDEAQDFAPLAIEILQSALAPGGKIWIALDKSQAIYSDTFVIPENFAQYHLNTNCRNTQEIHRAVEQYYGADDPIEFAGSGRTPVGRPVEHNPDVEDQAASVASIIERLVDEDDFAPQDIVVLSLHNFSRTGDQNSDVAKAPGKYKYVHVRDASNKPDEVRFSSIAGFKGLEASVVIACELDRIKPHNSNNLLYVAFSRARHRLITVGPMPDGPTPAMVGSLLPL